MTASDLIEQLIEGKIDLIVREASIEGIEYTGMEGGWHFFREPGGWRSKMDAQHAAMWMDSTFDLKRTMVDYQNYRNRGKEWQVLIQV